MTRNETARATLVMTFRLSLPFAVVTFLAASAVPALGHGGAELTSPPAWSDWHFTPDIVIATALVALVYATGMARRGAIARPPPWWRHAMFFGGLGAIFVALQSPVDAIAERLFSMHQIQHLLLRMIGPMLLALAWPEGVLMAGLPSAIRRTVLAPVVSGRITRGIFGVIAQPAMTAALFIGALYFWQIPRYHDLAILDEPVHYVMHVTMLAAGLVFWWRVLDRRPAPQGVRYGVRLMMLWLVILSNIVLGAYTTLKTAVLYPAYDVLGRLWDYAPLADERLGGIIIWIPGSMMCLVGLLVVIHMWGRHETRIEERRAASNPLASVWIAPTSGAYGGRRDAAIEAAGRVPTGAELVTRQRPKNRALALGLGAFVLAAFATALLVGALGHLSGAGDDRQPARDSQGQHAHNGASSTVR